MTQNKQLKTFHCKLAPIIGIGAWMDLYEKDKCGIDGWMYNIVLPFLRFQVGVIYLP